MTFSASMALRSFPLKRQEAVMIFPCCWMSPASVNIDLESNICAATSLTPSLSNWELPIVKSGAWDWRRKCSLGNGIKLVLSFLISLLFWYPGNLSEAVVFDITWAMMWLISLNDGWAIFKFFWQILFNALFSTVKLACEYSIKLFRVKIAL